MQTIGCNSWCFRNTDTKGWLYELSGANNGVERSLQAKTYMNLNDMNLNESVETWKREEQQPFSGWDFSRLDGRMIEEQAPWSYSSRATELMRQSSSVIDLGTGGGERFLKRQADWPKRVVATEDYPPNFRLATERLFPFGAQVVDVRLTDDDLMPFTNGEFDLVLNRHSGFNAKEVARILAPGGTFLTQQIHGLWAYDLLAAFDAKPQWPEATLKKYVPQLKAAGLTIVNTQEWSGQLSFMDVDAIVYYLKAVPWFVPGFSVETHLEHLLALQRRLEGGEGLAFVARKYLIEARKGLQTRTLYRRGAPNNRMQATRRCAPPATPRLDCS